MKALATVSALAVFATSAQAQSISTFNQGGKRIDVVTVPAKVWCTPLKNLTFNLDTLTGLSQGTNTAFGFALDAHVAIKSYADIVLGFGLPEPLAKFQLQDLKTSSIGFVFGLGVKF